MVPPTLTIEIQGSVVGSQMFGKSGVVPGQEMDVNINDLRCSTECDTTALCCSGHECLRAGERERPEKIQEAKLASYIRRHTWPARTF